MRAMLAMRSIRALRTVPVILLAALFGSLPPLPLRADDVYLKNGRSFEGVVAEVGEAQVRVHMPGGTISLPRRSVDHVRKADSAFAEYLQKKSEIESREHESRGRAGEWVELARWARRNNLPQGAREAALTAAAIDPREPGLVGLLRGFGYVLDESLDRWISYDDSMRRHGFIQEAGTWISREEHAERAREREAERLQRQTAAAAQATAAATARLADAAMLRAQLDLAQQGGAGYGPGAGAGMTLGGYYGNWWPYSSSVFSVPGFGPGFAFGGIFSGRPFFSHRGGFDQHERHAQGERHEGVFGTRIGMGGHADFAVPAAPIPRLHP